ncbi:MAG: hypothetical protein ACR2P7_02655 [bacterium]
MTLAAPAARAASEICFDNTNAGATVNYYVYNDQVGVYGNFEPPNNIWQYRTEVEADPMRCVSVNDLRDISIGDLVVGGYQVEGKRIGEHTFTCPGKVRVTPSKLHRVVFRITGSTIFDSKCAREAVARGEFMHAPQAVVRAGRVCFDNANHGAIVDYHLRNGGKSIWKYTGEQALEPERCVDVADLSHDDAPNGAELGATLFALGTTDDGWVQCPSTFIADRKSKHKIKFTVTGKVVWNYGCKRTTQIK